jgi:hypothetical protein
MCCETLYGILGNEASRNELASGLNMELVDALKRFQEVIGDGYEEKPTPPKRIELLGQITYLIGGGVREGMTP